MDCLFGWLSAGICAGSPGSCSEKECSSATSLFHGQGGDVSCGCC